MIQRRMSIALISVIMVSLLGGFIYLNANFRADEDKRILVVSTTTSLYDTGILDEIEEDFETDHDIDLRFISVGTGLAIAHAKRGDADMILVHAPPQEISFMEEGFGVCRKIFAYNFFGIVGPDTDPAKIKDKTPIDAFVKLVEDGRAGRILWVSRGDGSGTHSKEKTLWSTAGFDSTEIREEEWYRESGTGMGKTLQIAEELQAYTLTDMGTYLRYSREDLVTIDVIVGAGEELINVYSAIAVNPEANIEVHFDESIEFIKFLVSKQGQEIIDNYGVDKYGVNLFNGSIESLKADSVAPEADWIKNYAYWSGSECPLEYRAGQSKLYN